MMNQANAPVVDVHMLIRKPVDVVFEAFVDPAVTSRFWFTHGSGRLVEGATVTWEWEMYGASVAVAVKAVERHRRILVEWPMPVEWTFTPRGAEATFVRVTASGFGGSGDERVAQALDATGGFSYLLAAAKAFLEHGIELNLVRDHNPDAHIARF